MAKRNCTHPSVRHTWGPRRHPDGSIAPYVCLAAHCVPCGETLSLGPSNDDAPSEELLAAELAQNPDVLRAWLNYSPRIDDDLSRLHVTVCLYLGYASPDAKHTEIDPPTRWSWGERHDYLAGWLAREISDDTHAAAGWPWDPSRPVAGQYEEWLARGDALIAAMGDDAAQQLVNPDGFAPVDTASHEPWADPAATTQLTDDELVTRVAYTSPGSAQEDTKS